MADQAPEPWLQRPREGERPYAAFLAYRDMPVAKRSIRDVAVQLGKSATLIGRWSSQHRWVDRVAAWDAHLEQAKTNATIDEIAEMAKRHVQQASLIQSRAIQSLTRLAQDSIPFNPRDAVWALDVASKMERLARGQATERSEVTQTGGDEAEDTPERRRSMVLALLADPDAARLALRLHERVHGVDLPRPDAEPGAPGAVQPGAGVGVGAAPGGAERGTGRGRVRKA